MADGVQKLIPDTKGESNFSRNSSFCNGAPSKICRENGNNFNKNLWKARMERLMTNVRGHAATVYDAGGDRSLSAAYVDKIFRSALMSNLEHIVGDIHNILKAYYKPACERFVDTIC
jgi:hypothetical protein